MKKFNLFLICFLSAVVIYAQKPTQGYKGFTAGINGLIQNITVNGNASTTGTLLFKYYLADDLALRGGINFGKLSGLYDKDGVTFVEYGKTVGDTAQKFGGDGIHQETKTCKGSQLNFEIGAQKSFGDNEKLEPYMGGALFFGKTFGAKIESTKEAMMSTTPPFYSPDTILKGDVEKYTLIPATTFVFGVKLVAGFNYFIAKDLCLGAEFAWGLSKSTKNAFNTKGIKELTESNTGINNKKVIQPEIITKAIDTSKESRGGFGTLGALVTLSWFFN
ncbi:MAG: hypothetical protein WC223_08140 [Bacteroidales bacterium]|jgi:hypothetical protein